MIGNPQDAGGWYRLGNEREDEGRDAEALECFERAIAMDPEHAKAWNNLGTASQRLGDLARAEEAYRTALAHDPGDGMLAHLFAAAAGRNPERAPRQYVEALFDQQAPRFEEHLVNDLGYRIPGLLADLVRPTLVQRPARVLDLGCGTGLAGAALKECTRALAVDGIELTGVDLSTGMLQQAARRGIYATLEQADALDALAACAEGGLAAVIAADVFIYIGELREIFAAAARARPGRRVRFLGRSAGFGHLPAAAQRPLCALARLPARPGFTTRHGGGTRRGCPHPAPGPGLRGGQRGPHAEGLNTTRNTAPKSSSTGTSLNQRSQTWLLVLRPSRKSIISLPHQAW